MIFEVAMKIYAVKKGRVPGVYRNWDEAKKQVDGFSGAEYKSFENITDAIDYLGWQEKSHICLFNVAALINTGISGTAISISSRKILTRLGILLFSTLSQVLSTILSNFILKYRPNREMAPGESS
ncbi:ribonuclease HI [Lactobacillus amylovorus]|uniref:Ribonuclease H n=1 Tax=Lactobacillus amylovorus TaxID=1604 RepID=F0TI00_LACAM|nr:ribonuclease HI [Lactobacillus amylovorus]